MFIEKHWKKQLSPVRAACLPLLKCYEIPKLTSVVQFPTPPINPYPLRYPLEPMIRTVNICDSRLKSLNSHAKYGIILTRLVHYS